jgi:hypothetical protein
MDVRSDSTPARSVTEPTSSQSMSAITVVAPIVATAVCAIVLTARIPAAFHHFIHFTFLNICNTFLSLHIKKDTHCGCPLITQSVPIVD